MIEMSTWGGSEIKNLQLLLPKVKNRFATFAKKFLLLMFFEPVILLIGSQ